jgi:hypothetical protein
MAGSKQSGEGAGSRARGFGAFIGANAETLDPAPALGTLSSEKMGSPLPVAAAAFLSLRFLAGHLLLQLGGEFVLHFADLVQQLVEPLRRHLLPRRHRSQHVHQQQAHPYDLG